MLSARSASQDFITSICHFICLSVRADSMNRFDVFGLCFFALLLLLAYYFDVLSFVGVKS